MIIKEALSKGISFLHKNEVPTPELDARWLLEWILKLDATEFILKSNSEISEDDYNTFRVMLERRAFGEPLAYIQNEKEFYGHTFFVNENVLIPRPETELIIDFTKEYFMESESLVAADFGSGSGCLAITIAKEFVNSKVYALEYSNQAIEVIQQNIESLNVSDQVQVIQSDLNVPELKTEIEASSLDLVVANPPYIDVEDNNIQKEVKKYEPHLALFAEDNGLKSIKVWSAHAINLLKSRGVFLMEIGATQKNETIEYLKRLNVFEDINCYQDLSGLDRVIYARKR